MTASVFRTEETDHSMFGAKLIRAADIRIE
jgi:hypothetical protein